MQFHPTGIYRRRLPDHRRLARRRRLSGQFRRRALHGALRAIGQGSGFARRRFARHDRSKSARDAASARTRIISSCTSIISIPAVLHERLPGIAETGAHFRQCRRDARADPGAADRALQHGRHRHELSRRGADQEERQCRHRGPWPDGAWRGRLRVGAWRQSARLQFADRSGGIRPRRRASLRRVAHARRQAARIAEGFGRPRACAPRQIPQRLRRHADRAVAARHAEGDAGPDCAVFRTGEVLDQGHKLIHDVHARHGRRCASATVR